MNLNERVEQLLDAGPEHGVGSAQYLAAITKLVHPLFARRAMRACAAYLDSVLLARPAPNLRKEYKATGISMAQVQALSRLSPKAKRYAKVAPEVIDALAVVAAMGVGGAFGARVQEGAGLQNLPQSS